MKRRIYCIQDLENMNRSSLNMESYKSPPFKQKILTKKLDKPQLLPKIEIGETLYNSNRTILSSKKKKSNVKQTPTTEGVTKTPIQINKKSVIENNSLLKNGTLGKEQMHLSLSKVARSSLKERKSLQTPIYLCNEKQVDKSTILTPQEDDIEFKPRHKKKININAKRSLRKTQKKSLCSSNENINNLNKKSKRRKTHNPIVNESSFIQKVQNESNILTITPDTSGHNQGIFDVSYPFDEEFISNESLFSLSTLENEQEETNRDNKKSFEVLTNLNKTDEVKLEISSSNGILSTSTSKNIQSSNIQQNNFGKITKQSFLKLESSHDLNSTRNCDALVNIRHLFNEVGRYSSPLKELSTQNFISSNGKLPKNKSVPWVIDAVNKEVTFQSDMPNVSSKKFSKLSTVNDELHQTSGKQNVISQESTNFKENSLDCSERKLQSSKTPILCKENFNRSVINLITPSPEDKKFETVVYNSLSTPTPTKSLVFFDEVNKIENFRLDRSHTFTKDNNDFIKDTIEDTCLNETQKSGRKCWRKSKRISVLDNTGNFHIITDSKNKSFLDKSSDILPRSINKHLNRDLKKHSKFLSSTPASHKKATVTGFTTNSSTKSTTKASKMPNFALIHLKASDKLENIKEMYERKAARAQLLLSGMKPEVGLTRKTPTKSRKALNYSPKTKEGVTSEKTKAKEVASQPITQQTFFSKLHEKKTMQIKKPNTMIPVINQQEQSRKKTVKQKHSLGKNNIPECGLARSKVPIKKPVMQQEHLKALANKQRTAPPTVDTRRKIIQNVRTNRRFELLMQMRKK